MVFGDLDIAQLLGGFDGKLRYLGPVFVQQSLAHLAAELAAPLPFQAEAVGFHPIAALLPGCDTRLDGRGDFLQGKGDKGCQVTGLGVRLGLLHQLADGDDYSFCQAGAIFSGALRVYNTRHAAIIPGVSL